MAAVASTTATRSKTITASQPPGQRIRPQRTVPGCRGHRRCRARGETPSEGSAQPIRAAPGRRLPTPVEHRTPTSGHGMRSSQNPHGRAVGTDKTPTDCRAPFPPPLLVPRRSSSRAVTRPAAPLYVSHRRRSRGCGGWEAAGVRAPSTPARRKRGHAAGPGAGCALGVGTGLGLGLGLGPGLGLGLGLGTETGTGTETVPGIGSWSSASASAFGRQSRLDEIVHIEVLTCRPQWCIHLDIHT
jgi:hypothetical protein